MKQQGTLARRRRALERRATDTDDRVALRERRDHVSEASGTLERVELVPAVREAGSRVEVVVGPERDDEEVGLVDPVIGGHAPRLRVDRDDRLLEEPHAGLLDGPRTGSRVSAKVCRPNITSSLE